MRRAPAAVAVAAAAVVAVGAVVRVDNSRTGADSGVLESSDTYAYSSAVRR